MCGAEDSRQVRVRAAQDDLNLVGTNSLHFAELFGDGKCLGTEFGHFMAVKRINHIRRGERLAIVEHNVLAQLDGPGDRVTGIERLRQGHARHQLLVQRGQAVVEHVVTTVVGVVPALGRIQGVGGRTGRTGYLDAATTFAFTGASVGAGRGRGEYLAGRAEQAASTRDGHAGQSQHTQRITARHAAIESLKNTLAFRAADELGFGFILVVSHIVLPVDNEKALMPAVERSHLVTQTTVNQQFR
ncbi:hypothetical protein D9M68_602930 [compost metagenome]